MNVLQILADSFETRMTPFTLERPRCLLPLANTPLIEYTFEFLANAGVEDVFVYCGAHTDQLEEYIQNSKWISSISPFSKVEILRSSSHSIGDAMRDLDNRAVMTGDFIVVYGDIISNVPLESALNAHRERRLKDKNSIMTMVLREAGTQHRTKSHGVSPVFVVDPTQQRCLHYEQIRARNDNRRINIDADLLEFHDELEIRQDLIDCGIDICTPDVLALWSDNFDYEAPRRGFLHSVLKDYELNGKKLHTHIINHHYAARVKNLRAYDAVSKDIIGRWSYPLCPDSNLLKDQTYRLTKGLSYREEGVLLAGSCILGSKTVVGRATAIGDGSVVTNSVIGRRCIIGRNVKIDGAYIWDDVSIGDGTIIQEAIVANEASIGKRCRVNAGALISYGVALSDETTIAEKSRVTRMKKIRGYDEDEIVRGDTDPKIVGQNGDGFLYHDSEDEDDHESQSLGPADLYNMKHLSVSQESISTLRSEDEFTASMEGRDARSASFGSVTSDEGASNRDFHHEAVLQIYESLSKGDEASNVQLELTSLRMTSNVNPHQVRRAIVAAFMKRMATLVEAGETAATAAKKTIPSQAYVLKRCMFDYGDESEEKVDQVDFLLLMQGDLCKRVDGEKIMLHASNELVLGDIIETEGFEQWWEDERSKEGDDMLKVRSLMGQFMDAIIGSDEDSDEDDDEDEDEDEDEEDEDDEE